MTLAAGQFLSHYEILGSLGAGAMGLVYRARDTRLGRAVAIKVLPEEFAGDEERLRRFEHEARALACLNHPNIAHVYGIDQVGSVCFMAMELVPGEDLAVRLSRGALPLGEAISICQQIAEGVEVAHEAGVIHRDLKPANVVLTPDGRVKILDFGLAKSVENETRTGSGTASVQATEEGRLLGTPTYMAPEQVRGRSIDRRVDIWAFGCVLYECLTGTRAFVGTCAAETLAAVLDGQWKRNALPAATPPHVLELLERCLERDPRQRLRDIGEARVSLERGAPASTPRPARPRAPQRVAAVLLAALGVGLLVGRFALQSSAPPTPQLRPHQRLTELVGLEEMPAVSPQENFLAFTSRVNGRRQVFVRALRKGGASRPITHGDADHSFPRWVNESKLIYYRDRDGQDGSLWEIDVLTQDERRIGAAAGEADVTRAGRIATFRTSADGLPLLVLIDYGDRRVEEEIQLEEGAYDSPRWSPDGRSIAFQVRTLIGLSRGQIQVMRLDDRQLRTVVEWQWARGLSWLPDGEGLVYASSEGSTMGYPPTFGLRTVRLSGAQELAIPQSDAGYVSYVEPDVAASGRIVVSRVEMESDVYRFPLGGSPRENVEHAERITWQTDLVQTPCLSPDEEKVAYLSDVGGHANVWIARVDGSEPPRQITFEQDPGTIIGIPQWNPVRSLIVYVKQTGVDLVEQWLVDPEGADPPRPLCPSNGGAFWSPDGRWLYMCGPVLADGTWTTVRLDIDTGQIVPVGDEMVGLTISQDGSTGYFSPSTARVGEVWRVTPVEGGTREPLRTDLGARIPSRPHEYALSPNDQWLATPLVDQGTTNLWLLSTANGELLPVTDFQHEPTLICREVTWSRDSQHLFAALARLRADIVMLDLALR